MAVNWTMIDRVIWWQSNLRVIVVNTVKVKLHVFPEAEINLSTNFALNAPVYHYFFYCKMGSFPS